MNKPILCLDFDGVIHSYDSGWRGPRLIPDPPVPGALRFIFEATKHSQVAIHSSRSRYFLGRRAMQRWLASQYMRLGEIFTADAQWWHEFVWETAFCDPWTDEVEHATRLLMKKIQWPLFKPPAMVTLDDRAVRFDGRFPTPELLLQLKPWNKV